MAFNGYMNKRLRININKESVQEEVISEDFCQKFIGGKGFNTKILLDEVGPGIKPFSKENLLIFGVGPLIGTPAFSANRLTISAKSPLTGVIGNSSIGGGGLAVKMKGAGYDQIVITGKADKLIYLVITDKNIEFRDAEHLKGKSTSETMLLIKREIGDISAAVACIGPAGENLVRFACIITEDHAAGRTGMGAVMGSKNIKAIVFKGSKKPQVYDKEKLSAIKKDILQELNSDPAIEKAKKYGATTAVEALNSIGVLEVKNLQTGIFDEIEKISGKMVRDNYGIKKRGCLYCTIGCRSLSLFHSKEFGSFVLAGPEFASLQSFGSRIGNSNVESTCFMTKLANDYGLDFMSFCGVISWLMECYEKGLITEEDIDGISLNWGDYNKVILLMEKTAFRRGIGDILAEGSYRASRASEKFGEKTKEYALHVKKLEFENFDPRGYKGRGTGFGTSARGADNCTTLCSIESTLTEKQAEKLFGNKEAAKLTGVKGKGKLLKYMEDFTAVSELLGLCRYAMYAFSSNLDHTIARSKLLSKAFSYVTGMIPEDESLDFLVEAGERLINLERMYNVREGLTRKDDLLPERFRFEPLPEGPSKGSVIEEDQILDEYYEERGWDKETGIPLDSTLKRLKLKI